MTRPLFDTGDHANPVDTKPTRAGQTPMPDWLITKLETSGHIDRETRATRRARAATCPTCHRGTVIGLDGDPSRRHGGYMARTCDPQPLNPAGEALAILAGRPTFALTWRFDHYEIDGPRNQFTIPGNPAGSRIDTDILVAHDCKIPPPENTAPRPPTPQRKATANDDPPF